jgi:Electron transfer DM13
MDAIGRFGRALFTALYDFRVPIAVASIAVALAFVLIAWRRGWFAAARRHPVRSGIALVVAVVIGAPLGWYLASPIWIRTSLVEAAPTPAAASANSAAPAQETPPAPPIASTAPVATSSASAYARTTLASGTFHGTDEFHFGRGTARIIEVAPGRYHLGLEDFSVRNGPDLYVYLSTAADDYADDALEVGTLKATDGSFGYDLPAGSDPTRFRSAIIWCKQFSHLFAVAPL